MLEAHADEIGFIICYIDEKGFVYIVPIGGSDRTISAARRLRFFGDKGEVLGIIGNTAIHLREKNKDKIPEWHELFVDVGAASAEDVAKLGLRVGTPAVFQEGAQLLPSGRITGRGIDNRVGCHLTAKILHGLQTGNCPDVTTVAVNAVQEEIGCHGAGMIAHRLRPDYALVFDVTHATDTPGINHKQHGKICLGKGPAVSHGSGNHPKLVARLVETAEKLSLPLQHEPTPGRTSTDTDVIYKTRAGIPSALVSIPLRYMHSPSELIDYQDVEIACTLVSAFLRDFPAGGL